jgi:hypothetical protein
MCVVVWVGADGLAADGFGAVWVGAALPVTRGATLRPGAPSVPAEPSRRSFRSVLGVPETVAGPKSVLGTGGAPA